MESATTAHVPPQNIEVEESVLGAMLVSEPTLTRVIDEVKILPGDFYLDRHRVIFSCIYDLYEASKPVDELSVAEALVQRNEIDQAGGKHYVSELAAKVPAAGNARHYAEIVQENSLLRRLLGAGQEIQGWVNERDGKPRELTERAEKLLFEVAHKRQASDFRMLSEILHEEVDRLEKLSTGELELTGTPSGFKDIDAITGGFQPGNLVIFAARPAMGKSALVANIAENVATKHQQPVAFFSLEMSEVELAQRFIACRARLSGDKLRKGEVKKSDWPKVVRACNELEQAPLWFDDSSDLGILDLRAKARRLHAQTQDQGGLGLIIVDYLQLMRSDDHRANRVEQVSQMSRGLKILARELEVPVLAISQLSRAPEQRTPPRPQLSDLRESGAIEQDADLVAFLYREDYYHQYDEGYEPDGLAEVIIAKHRNGPIGNPRLVFMERFPKFANYSGRDEPVGQPADPPSDPLEDAAAAGPDF
jgi:replicative DNA helicase